MDDIDLVTEIATLSVAAATLGMRAAEMAPGECLRVKLVGDVRVMSRDEAVTLAADMLDRRNALLDAAGPLAADRIIREIGYGYALTCAAETAARSGVPAGGMLAAVEAPRPPVH
jgi:hypothetical protein